MAVEYLWDTGDGLLQFHAAGVEYDAAFIGHQSTGVSTMSVFGNTMWDGSVWAAGLAQILSPDAMFTIGQPYGWAIVAPNTVLADTAGTTPGVVDATIRRLDDQRGAPWLGVTTGPTLRNTGGVYWLEFAQTAGRELQITVPAITNGTLMIAYKNAGVMSGNVTISAGTYSVGRWDNAGVVGVLLIDRDLSQDEREQVRQWFIAERGAGSFSAATSFLNLLREQKITNVDLFNTAAGTNFQNFLQGNQLQSVPLFNTAAGTSFNGFMQLNQLQSVPLFNTAAGTNFQNFLQGNQLQSVPLFNTAAGTIFQNFCAANPGLANVPVGLFDNVKGTNFTNIFQNCALTQQSVDNILVSVATAAAANNLNNGTLNLNSGTNATPSATGVAAKDALVLRGWTVTTN